MSKLKYDRSVFITRADGTKQRIRVRGNNRKEVESRIAEIRFQEQSGLLTFNSNTPFSVWMEEWLNIYKKPKVTSGTYNEICGIMQRCFGNDLGSMKISDIRLPHVQKCLNAMEGYSKSYIHRAYIYIKACFQKAWEAEMISRSPCIGLEEPNATIYEERRALTAEERRYFLESIQTHHKGAFFGVMYACGLRPAEARGLTWFNINMRNKTLTVAQSCASKSKDIKRPKTEAGKRTIPIPDWYMEMLKKVERTESPYVFPNTKGQPMNEQRYLKTWHSLLREMEIRSGAQLYRNKIIMRSPVIGEDLKPYNLRHTYATELAEKGVPLKTAQYLLGHADIRITANIYTHITEKMIEEAREKINL